MRSHSYLNTTKRIIDHYDGSIPLSAWLKQFFKAEKKFGSTDRKQIAHASYCYYRLGSAFSSYLIDERILIGLFLCSESGNVFLEELKPEWNHQINIALRGKLLLLNADGEIKLLFPFHAELTDDVNMEAFNLSFLVQPDLFLRMRPGKKEKLLAQLQEEGIEYDLLNKECIQVPNKSRIDEILQIDTDVVVQDYNSQQVLQPLEEQLQHADHLTVWDCCAASGGKTILFYDHYPAADITVSDVRDSIMINLQNRFKRAAIKNYHAFVADISAEDFIPKRNFDIVICDAPCSGSGTWSRTPEQLFFFKKEKIGNYASLQKRIALNASKAVRKGGYFLYITCSVFKKENEDVVEFIQNNTSLQLQSMQYFKGYDQKADTLFVALFSL
jgi:16S rRNA (cytosine967-C5)-methyltransferase